MIDLTIGANQQPTQNIIARQRPERQLFPLLA
jgi:hypothetical protein